MSSASKGPDLRAPAVAGRFYPGSAGRSARHSTAFWTKRPRRGPGPPRWCPTPAGLFRPLAARAQPRRDSRSRDRLLAQTQPPRADWAVARTGPGRPPARSSPIPSWPASWPMSSPAWSSTPPRTSRSTRSRSNCRSWPDSPPGRGSWSPCTAASSTPSSARRPDGGTAGRDAQAAAAGHLHRHEPLCRRPDDAAARPACPRCDRVARPGRLFETVSRNRITMCGVVPAVLSETSAPRRWIAPKSSAMRPAPASGDAAGWSAMPEPCRLAPLNIRGSGRQVGLRPREGGRRLARPPPSTRPSRGLARD